MSAEFKNCIFSYYLSNIDCSFDELPIKYSFGEYILNADSRTPFVSYKEEERECAVFGYAVDVMTREGDSLAEKLLKASKDINSVIEYEKRLGGKYLILYRDTEDYYLLGDATCSIPSYFSKDTEAFICTSNPEYIVKKYALLENYDLQKIRDSGEISQAMPFDVTPYKEIKQLVPNHYVVFSERISKRFVNSAKKQKKLSISEATDTVFPMIENILNYFQSKFKIYCPITSGRDSRVVLAFLQGLDCIPVKSYTIKHKEHKENEQDLVIPEKLCELVCVDYEQIFDAEVSEQLKTAADDLLGKGKYSARTLMIANTINSNYGDGAIINGDIIGQVGKCSLHRDIPSVLATAGYFRCKLHNYSKGAKEFIKAWLNEIKTSGEKINKFDLFSVENRMGRWAGKENLIYNSIGQVYINVFNSRSIVYVWSSVRRSERKKSKIHIALIERKCPILLSVPFENDESFFVRCSKLNGIFYYLSSYLKYYIEKRRFLRKRQ